MIDIYIMVVGAVVVGAALFALLIVIAMIFEMVREQRADRYHNIVETAVLDKTKYRGRGRPRNSDYIKA